MLDGNVETPFFGNGRFSRQQDKYLSQVTELLGLPLDKGIILVRAMASDAGNALKHGQSTLKVGKSTAKTGLASISEATKVKGYEVTPSLQIVHALDWMSTAGSHGVLYKHAWVLTEALQNYIDSL